jgi:hypothetical protein
MRKIIGAALIVLSLAGCAGGNFQVDSSGSQDFWRDKDRKPS